MSKEFAALVHHEVQKKNMSIKEQASGIGLCPSVLRGIFAGRSVREETYKKLCVYYPELKGTGHFRTAVTRGPRLLNITSKGLEKLKALQPQETTKRVVLQVKAQQAARVTRGPKETKSRLPLRVITGLVWLLREEKVKMRILELSDWAEDNGHTLGELVHAAEAL